MSQPSPHPFLVANRVGLFSELPSAEGSGVGRFCVPRVTGDSYCVGCLGREFKLSAHTMKDGVAIVASND